MTWGTKTHATQLTHITSEQFFSTEISLGVGEHTHCQIQGNFPDGAVDTLYVQCFATLDASGENWDSQPFHVVSIYPNTPVISFIVEKYYKFRVSVFRSGTTDDISADLWYRTAVSVL